jgi:hypothetical protein
LSKISKKSRSTQMFGKVLIGCWYFLSYFRWKGENHKVSTYFLIRITFSEKLIYNLCWQKINTLTPQADHSWGNIWRNMKNSSCSNLLVFKWKGVIQGQFSWTKLFVYSIKKWYDKLAKKCSFEWMKLLIMEIVFLWMETSLVAI